MDLRTPQDRSDSSQGFTLVELMVVVVIVAVLASIAVAAYQRYMRDGYVVQAQEMVAQVQARQETYFQESGEYCAVSGNAWPGSFYPALIDGQEPIKKEWGAVPVPANWVTLGARPESRHSFFTFNVVASLGPTHAPDAVSELRMGIPPQPTPASGLDPHPWYYVVAEADLDGSLGSYGGNACGTGTTFSGIGCTVLTASSARVSINTYDRGE